MKTVIPKCFFKNANTLKKEKEKAISHIIDDLESSSVDSDE